VTVTLLFAVAALAFLCGGVFYTGLTKCRVGIDPRLFENSPAQANGEFGTKGYEDFTIASLKLIDDDSAVIFINENVDWCLRRNSSAGDGIFKILGAAHVAAAP